MLVTVAAASGAAPPIAAADRTGHGTGAAYERAPATGHAAASCPNFAIGTSLRATRVRRRGRVSCERVRYMIRGTYTLDRGKVRRHRIGRPTVYYRGGWACSNGAGGAGCSDSKHRTWRISANVS